MGQWRTENNCLSADVLDDVDLPLWRSQTLAGERWLSCVTSRPASAAEPPEKHLRLVERKRDLPRAIVIGRGFLQFLSTVRPRLAHLCLRAPDQASEHCRHLHLNGGTVNGERRFSRQCEFLICGLYQRGTGDLDSEAGVLLDCGQKPS